MNGNPNDRGKEENRDEEKTYIRVAQGSKARPSFVSGTRAAPEYGLRERLSRYGDALRRDVCSAGLRCRR